MPQNQPTGKIGRENGDAKENPSFYSFCSWLVGELIWFVPFGPYKSEWLQPEQKHESLRKDQIPNSLENYVGDDK